MKYHVLPCLEICVDVLLFLVVHVMFAVYFKQGPKCRTLRIRRCVSFAGSKKKNKNYTTPFWGGQEGNPDEEQVESKENQKA